MSSAYSVVGSVDLDSFFKSARDDINERLAVQIEGTTEKEKLEYFLSRGKRLRPLLCILVFRACGGREEDYLDALDLAAAIELQHSASLVHDDIIDGDLERRDKPSYHRLFGVEDAILIGHRAIVLGFQNALRHSPEAIGTLFDVWEKSLVGELRDIAARKETLSLLESGEDYYFEAIGDKTASLFAGAAKVGSQKAGAPQELQSLFWEYGRNIGLAYQLADDSQDIHGGSEELSLTWIVKQLDEATRKSFISHIKDGVTPAAALSELDVDIQELFLKEIQRMKHAAEDLAINRLIPESEYKPLLLDIPQYMIDKFLES